MSSPSILFRRLISLSPWLLLVVCLAAPAHAQESFATYPPLPVGYSSIRVFDNQSRFVGRILPDRRYWTPIERIPQFLQKALVAVEDARFYEHGGIDVRGIARALMKDVVKGRLVEGGSTITQQLIKNRYLTGAKTIERKLEEARMAIEFEKKYTKRQILEMYFNEIYYGNGAWGIAQAALFYFDKTPEELTDAECAMLAGVPKNPGRYNPLGKPDQVVRRRDVVLQRMVELNMISRTQQQYLRAHPPTVVRRDQAPYYMAHVRNRLVERFGAGIIDRGGLDVFAALDLNLQKAAEKDLSEGVKRLSPQLQGALVCLDPVTGNLLAAVGGVDFAKSPYDRAFNARRQPGSAIKPMIYAAALEKGFTPASIFDDTPVTYNRGNGEVWQPLNYGDETFGRLSLRQALAYSNNVVAVKLLDAIGVPTLVDFAGRVGLSLNGENGLSLALGTNEVTLNDLVLAYAPLANGGSRPVARTIVRIYDRQRRAWAENPQALTPVMAPATAYVTTSMLEDVLQYGTAKGLKRFAQERPAAGKTGTTSDYRDAWFIGYTPQLVTGVWVGYDKPRPGGRGFTGGAVAAPIWGRFMRTAEAGKPVVDFTRPDTVVTVAIDPATGCPAPPESTAKREFFIAGTQPTADCTPLVGVPTGPAQPFQPGTPGGVQPGASEGGTAPTQPGSPDFQGPPAPGQPAQPPEPTESRP